MNQQNIYQLNLVSQALVVALKALQDLQKVENAENKQKQKNISSNECGFYYMNFKKIKSINPKLFFTLTNMNAHLFDRLLSMLKTGLMQRNNTVSAECKLAILLMYLSQATSMKMLASLYKLEKKTVRSIILDTSAILCKILYETYLAAPTLEQQNEIENDYWRLYKMPNCIGAIDGKLIALRCPESRQDKHDSIALLATCDAKYRFTRIEIVACSKNQNGIFQRSKLGTNLRTNRLSIPAWKCLPETTLNFPHYFAVSDNFPISMNLMRPYTSALTNKKQQFNNILRHAHGTIENAFGILVTRWKILQTSLSLSTINSQQIVLACVLLHNFLMYNDVENSTYSPHNYVDWIDSNKVQHAGLWRSVIEEELPQIRSSSAQMHYGAQTTTLNRNNLCNYIHQIRRILPIL